MRQRYLQAFAVAAVLCMGVPALAQKTGGTLKVPPDFCASAILPLASASSRPPAAAQLDSLLPIIPRADYLSSHTSSMRSPL